MTFTPKNSDPISRREALRFVWDVCMSVSVLAAVFALIGRSLDRRWDTFPYLTIAALAGLLAATAWLIRRKAKAMVRRMIAPRA